MTSPLPRPRLGSLDPADDEQKEQHIHAIAGESGVFALRMFPDDPALVIHEPSFIASLGLDKADAKRMSNGLLDLRVRGILELAQPGYNHLRLSQAGIAYKQAVDRNAAARVRRDEARALLTSSQEHGSIAGAMLFGE